MYLIIDIETENTGTDIMEDNKRILSIQIGNDAKQSLYWADSKDPKLTLEAAKRKIASLLSQGVVFAGYNVKGFDIPLLKQFLDIDIPESNTLDLCQPSRTAQLTGKNKARLEEVCAACGIEVTHKQRMNEKAERYKSIEAHKNKASAKAKELVKKKGWSEDFAYNYALDKIAGGTAIYDAYLEFAKGGGKEDTLFYEYAIGDVISEYQLLKKLGY